MHLRLPTDSSPALQRIAQSHFDSDGFLRNGDLRRFERVLEKLRATDETTVVYSDVPEFIDRENELASGLEEEAAISPRWKKVSVHWKAC